MPDTKAAAVPEARTCVGVLFGGPSAEHEVSAASALAVIRGLRATGPAELSQAVDAALRYDDVVLVEQAITARELLCGVIGDADEAEATAGKPGQTAPGWCMYRHMAHEGSHDG